MRNIEEQLRNWRESRNIKDFPLTIKEDLLSEVEEVKQALNNRDWDNYVEELADVAIFAFNGIGLLNIVYNKKSFSVESTLEHLESCINNINTTILYQTYTLLCTIVAICEELVTEKRYDFKKVVLEKIKLLNSRKQSIEQKENWNKYGANGKWEKSELKEDKDRWYKPNYSRCKLDYQK